MTGATTYPNATPTGTPIRTFAYSYDLAGNRTSAALNGTPTSYTYNNRNQLTSDGTHTFGYDKNGNRISAGTLSTVWDRVGRMLSHDGHGYAYDGEGRRIAQTAGGSTTRYVLDVQRGLPAVIGAKAGSDITHYMHGPLGMFAQRNPDASWDWMLHDGLGSVRGVFDGTLQSAAEYDPFGEPIVAPIGTAYGFTGELTDGNGLVYLRARYLAPSLGTFASRDPWRGTASAPRTWNGYAWVEGNVVNRVDASGMCAQLTNLQQSTSCDCAQSQANFQEYLDCLSRCGRDSAKSTNPLATIITHAPLLNGCEMVRGFQEHLTTAEQDPREAGTDYIFPGDTTADPRTRILRNKEARTVLAVADGTIINVTRSRRPENLTTGDHAPAEQYGVTLETLSCDAQQCVIVQYTHVYPTVDAPGYQVARGQSGRPWELTQDEDQHTWLRGETDFVNFLDYSNPILSIPQERVNSLQGPAIQAGEPLGFYAQIGRSTTVPHLHISLFVGPSRDSGEFHTWLASGDRGGVVNPEPYIPCG